MLKKKKRLFNICKKTHHVSVGHPLKSLGWMILVGPFQLRIFRDLKISSTLQSPIPEIISDGGFMRRDATELGTGIRSGSSGVWFRFFPRPLCWGRTEIGRTGRWCLAAFCHPGFEGNPQRPFPARGLTCHCRDQWFRKLEFFIFCFSGKA